MALTNHLYRNVLTCLTVKPPGPASQVRGVVTLRNSSSRGPVVAIRLSSATGPGAQDHRPRLLRNSGVSLDDVAPVRPLSGVSVGFVTPGSSGGGGPRPPGVATVPLTRLGDIVTTRPVATDTMSGSTLPEESPIPSRKILEKIYVLFLRVWVW